jgi:hypothetical protein
MYNKLSYAYKLEWLGFWSIDEDAFVDANVTPISHKRRSWAQLSDNLARGYHL